VFEIHRTFPSNRARDQRRQTQGDVHRGYADYINSNGLSVNYTVYTLDNGDKFYTHSSTMGQADAAGKRTTPFAQPAAFRSHQRHQRSTAAHPSDSPWSNTHMDGASLALRISLFPPTYSSRAVWHAHMREKMWSDLLDHGCALGCAKSLLARSSASLERSRRIVLPNRRRCALSQLPTFPYLLERMRLVYARVRLRGAPTRILVRRHSA